MLFGIVTFYVVAESVSSDVGDVVLFLAKPLLMSMVAILMVFGCVFFCVNAVMLIGIMR